MLTDLPSTMDIHSSVQAIKLLSGKLTFIFTLSWSDSDKLNCNYHYLYK